MNKGSFDRYCFDFVKENMQIFVSIPSESVTENNYLTEINEREETSHEHVMFERRYLRLMDGCLQERSESPCYVGQRIFNRLSWMNWSAMH